jgi:hypothetical protein
VINFAPWNAVAALAVLRNSDVPADWQAPLTAAAAITPGVMGLAVPFVAAGAAAGRGKRGGGGGQLRGGRTPLQFQTVAPPPPSDTTPTYVQVPLVVDKPFDRAKALIEEQNLVVGWVDVPTVGRDPGFVIEQRIEANRWVPEGTQINLLVSKAAPPDAVTEASEMSEMKTIEGKVDRLKADVDAKLGHVEKSLNHLADRIAAQGQGNTDGAPSGDTDASGVKRK